MIEAPRYVLNFALIKIIPYFCDLAKDGGISEFENLMLTIDNAIM
jgi:hypothetical protein